MSSPMARIIASTVFRSPLFILMLPTLLILSCGSPDDTETKTEKTKYGGVLYFGVETGFYGFDVVGAHATDIHNPNMTTLMNLIMEPLFRIDPEGKPIPVLALSAAP